MAETDALLDEELKGELGQTDDNNPLLIVGRKDKKQNASRKTKAEKRTRSEVKIEEKKDQKKSLDEVYEELRKNALSMQDWNRLQALCKPKKKRKKRKMDDADNAKEEKEAGEEEEEAEKVESPLPHYISAPAEETQRHQEKNIVVELDQEETSAASPTDVAVSKKADLVAAQPPLRVVYVERTESVRLMRSELPIIGHEQEIMELVSLNDVVILCGPTGCGKTTQVPQFLYEAGYGCAQYSERAGLIGVTQPRRIAATSIAKRVAEELNSSVGGAVGYQVRYDSRLRSTIRIKFMTDGVLIRELQQDFLLKNYSVVILDEAHERSLNTDLLIGMLSRVVVLRRKMAAPPLKLIIMSATLESGTFLTNAKLFAVPPPVYSIPSRQFSVTIHFSRTTVENYELLALRKVCKIHRLLPPGGILVFLTGKREIDAFCQKLHRRLEKDWITSSDELSSEEEDIEITPGEMEEKSEKNDQISQKVKILPLYAMLPPQRQAFVFQKMDPDTRLIVVATNIAETSVTIPGIRYVVDSGRSKKKIFNPQSGVASFEVDWISKASAIQRAGRAGRTLPGHCYRLYSSAHFAQALCEHDLAEISCVSLEGVVLLLKSMGIAKTQNFPFPSNPRPEALTAAEETLIALSAVEQASGKITQLGRQMVEFPISPRHSRMILRAIELEQQQQTELTHLTLYAISLAAAMSLDSPFLQEARELSFGEMKQIQRQLHCKISDPLSSLLALLVYKERNASPLVCQEIYLNDKVMKEMAALDKQLRQIFLKTIPDIPVSEKRTFLKACLPWPSEKLLTQLRKCITSGWCDHIARREAPITTDSIIKKRHRNVPYAVTTNEGQFFLHPTSIVARRAPDFVVYLTAQQTNEKTYLQCVTKVEADWFFSASHSLSEVIYPSVMMPGAFYEDERDGVYCWHRVLYGKHRWELPLQSIECQDAEIAAGCFASALLEGRILASDWLDSEKLVMSTSYTKTIEVRFHKRLGLLISKLKQEYIWSKENLQNALKKDPKMLQLELKLWIKKDYWEIYMATWNQWTSKLIYDM